MTGETEKQKQPAQGSQDWYAIEVEGNFNPGWFDWLDGWEITPLPGGDTLLSGWVIDQPALHGIFARIRDLNLKLISVNTWGRPQPAEIQKMKEQERE